MRKFKILALTDHLAHSRDNSVYSLLSELSSFDQVSQISVSSRGITDNSAFFQDPTKPLYASNVNESFSYDENGSSYVSYKRAYINEFDIVFLRLPRPVSDDYLKALKNQFENKLIINDPIGIINTSNKTYLLNFPDICPPMKFCKSIKDIKQFCEEFECILKPLKEYGGKGIVRIIGDQVDNGVQVQQVDDYLESIHMSIENEGMLAMKFLRNVDQGDKRTIVVGGRIMASSLRLPAQGKWICNVSQGGRSRAASPTTEEFEIVEEIRGSMKKEGIHIYGIDTLVNDDGKRTLSEINTLSVGGFPQAQKQTGLPIIKLTNNSIIKLANEYYNN